MYAQRTTALYRKYLSRKTFTLTSLTLYKYYISTRQKTTRTESIVDIQYRVGRVGHSVFLASGLAIYYKRTGKHSGSSLCTCTPL